MDSHPEIAEQLRKNPSLVNNQEFVENHPALQTFLLSIQECARNTRKIRTHSCIRSIVSTAAKTKVGTTT